MENLKIKVNSEAENTENLISGADALRALADGIEIPAPFEPKEGDYFYVICPTSLTGYTEVFAENQKNLECFTKFGAWRSEKEIMQVVAALRQVLGRYDVVNAVRGWK